MAAKTQTAQRTIAGKTYTVYAPYFPDRCNGGAGHCAEPVAAKVVTEVRTAPKPVAFSDLMCADHAHEYFRRLLQGDRSVLAVEQI